MTFLAIFPSSGISLRFRPAGCGCIASRWPARASGTRQVGLSAFLYRYIYLPTSIYLTNLYINRREERGERREEGSPHWPARAAARNSPGGALCLFIPIYIPTYLYLSI